MTQQEIKDTNILINNDMNVETNSRELANPLDQEKQPKNAWEIEYAEGGWKAWSVVIGSFIGMFPTWGLVASCGVIQTYLMKNQLKDENISATSWIFSLYICLVLTCSVFSGLYFDRNGARKPIAFGAVLVIGGVFGLANSTKLWHFFLSLSITIGVGSGIVLSPLVSVVCHYFNRRRAMATALAMNGGSLGGVVLPIMFRKLFVEVGFPWTIRITGFIFMACYIVCILLVKEAFTTKEENEHNKRQRFMYYIVNAFDYRGLLEPKFLFLILGVVSLEVSLNTFATYLPSYAATRGYSDTTGSLFITVISALSIPGGYVPSVVADMWLGSFNVQIIVLTVSSALILIMVLPFGNDLGVMYAFCALYGFFFGSVISLTPVCCGQISKIEEFGRRYATMYCCVGLGTLVGIPIAGAIIDKGTVRNYNGFIWYCGAIGVAAAVFHIVSKAAVLGRKVMVKF